MKKNLMGKISIIALATALFGQVYINPFESDFRISIGVIVMALLIIKFKDVPIVSAMLFTGGAVVLFRVIVGLITGSDLITLMGMHYPTFFFYLAYGMLMKIMGVRSLIDQPILFIMFLGFVDVASNVLEAGIRYEFVNFTAKIVLPSLFIIGFSRAAIIFLLNLGLMFYNIIILKDESNERIKAFLMLASRMKTESFFLDKGMSDIENAMHKSYYLYNQMMAVEADDMTDAMMVDMRQEILELTKDIHEVKKDNERVIAGIEKLIPVTEELEELKFGDIVDMLIENTTHLAKLQQKQIDISARIIYKNMTIKNYYPMITILINLLSNAVEAIQTQGFISIEQHLDEDYFILEVKDSGSGIKEDQREIIFEPGFSTKFDSKTGQMSNGIGLTHVRALIEDYYLGDISLVDQNSGVTCFRTRFLKEKLLEVE